MSCARLWNRDDGRLMARFHGEFAMKAEELQLEENGLLHRPTKYRVQRQQVFFPIGMQVALEMFARTIVRERVSVDTRSPTHKRLRERRISPCSGKTGFAVVRASQRRHTFQRQQWPSHFVIWESFCAAHTARG